MHCKIVVIDNIWLQLRDFCILVLFYPHRIFQKYQYFFYLPEEAAVCCVWGDFCRSAGAPWPQLPPPQGSNLVLLISRPPPKLGAAIPVKGGYFRLVLGAECAEILTTAS